MPNRYLRESLKESLSLNALSFQAEVMWTRLLLTVDDWGRCEANPKILRPKLFPLRLDQVREADLQRWIAECEKAGLVRLYYSEGKAHIQMMKWEKGRALTSKFPNPPKEILECCFLKENKGESTTQFTDDNRCKPTHTDAPDPVSDPVSDPDNDPEIKKEVEKPPSLSARVKRVFNPDEIPYKAAEFFQSHLDDWTGKPKEPTKKQLQADAEVFETMFRLDGIDDSEFTDLLNWIAEHDTKTGFRWRDVIRSSKKLRQHWKDRKFSGFMTSKRKTEARLYG